LEIYSAAGVGEDDGGEPDYDVYLDPAATQSQALEAEEFDSKATPKAVPLLL
jgi:hypothetical protein